MMVPQEWIDVRIRAGIDAGELLAIVDDPAAQGAWEENGAVHLYWSADQWSERSVERLQAALRLLCPEADPAVTVERLPHQDWNRLWAQSVRPLRIGRRIIVRPSWEPVVLTPGDIEIVLDPKQAFGTGHHATTQLLMEWIEDVISGGERVLDVGTGSGILAMAALRLGARHAVGLDTDPVAIACARDYAQINELAEMFDLRCGTITEAIESARFDLLLANLDCQTLLQLSGELGHLVRTGARLLVSGLLVDQEAEIVDSFAKEDAFSAGCRERHGWLAMEFLAAESCEDSS